MFVKYFKETDRKKLAAMLALWISNGSVPFAAVLVLNNSHLVKVRQAHFWDADVFEQKRLTLSKINLKKLIVTQKWSMVW